MRRIALTLFVVLVSTHALAEDKTPPPAPTPIEVTETDQLFWERYQLLSRLATAQQDLLRLQNEKTLAEEYTKLNQRFLDHYKIPVDHLERRGDQWIRRDTTK